MSTLFPEARAVLVEAGVLVDPWPGDVCGCLDDRCIGFHHDADDACGCLSAQVEQAFRDRQAAVIWAARAAGDPTAGAQVRAWARHHFPYGSSPRFDVEVRGRRGISVAYRLTHHGVPEYAEPDPDGYRILVWVEP